MDWETDPELKEMRADFIASLDERRKRVLQALVRIYGKNSKLGWQELQEVAHKVAGVAAYYGFPVLGGIASLLDEGLDRVDLSSVPVKWNEYAELLGDALKISDDGEDATELGSDLRLKKLRAEVPADSS